MDIKNQDKIKYKELLEEKKKENEESWPGHASTRYQTAEMDRYVLIAHLQSIELELNKLI